MSFVSNKNPNIYEYPVPERYKAIETASQKSFYLNNPNRTMDVFQSVHSVGSERIDASSANAENLDATSAARRLITGGNMSTVGPHGPVELEDNEARIQDAKKNIAKFFDSLGIPRESAYILNPESDYTTPLTVVDVDAQETEGAHEWPVRLDTSGDFIYTRDPRKILTVRPADCPVMIATADTPEGKIYMMVHYAWKGAAHGYVQQTAKIFDTLGVDRTSLEIYLTPGGQAESFPYENYPLNPLEQYPGTEGLFRNPTNTVNEEGKEVWSFGIDTPKFVYDQVIEHFQVEPKQVFCDTSDTSSLDSGYSSHGRSSRLKGQGESNTRDTVIAVFNTTGHTPTPSSQTDSNRVQ